MRKVLRRLKTFANNDNFVHFVEFIEILVSKILSCVMILVIIAAIIDLIFFLTHTIYHHYFSQNVGELGKEAGGFISKDVFTVFGFFLNILIALEILENITAYLRKHVFQLELVIATSLIAVARKIIILDLQNTTGNKVVGLGTTILALSISYWIVRRQRRHDK